MFNIILIKSENIKDTQKNAEPIQIVYLRGNGFLQLF